MKEIINELKEYFDITELVCRDVYKRFGDSAWYFFDEKLLATLLFIRKRINAPITINNWKNGGQFSQRGLRCNRCELVRTKNYSYMSAHVLGKGVDFNVRGQTAEETRKAIAEFADDLPYPIRLERDCNWVHLDTRNYSNKKIEYFNG